MKEQILEDDLSNEEEKIQFSFNLANKHEKNKLDDIAKEHSLTKAGLIRSLILKEWRRLQQDKKDGNF